MSDIFAVKALAGMELIVLRAVCWVLGCGSVTRAVLTTDCVLAVVGSACAAPRLSLFPVLPSQWEGWGWAEAEVDKVGTADPS